MKKIKLTGKNLDYDSFKAIVFNNARIKIDDTSMKKAENARQVLFDMAEEGYPVYGLNRGVGWNKDKDFDKEFFEEYNYNLLNTHALGIPPYNTEDEVRAILLIRLNTALCGSTGMSKELIELYRDFLNYKITPIVPRRGSIGAGDIATISHIGLAFLGETDVKYQGKTISAKEAMAAEGLKKPVLGPKDGLSIVSSNAQGIALSVMVLLEAEEILELSNLIFSLGLEGLNGGIEPLIEEVNFMRGLEGQIACAAQCRKHLEGSYLYEPDPKRPLQDPLCFRSGCAINGSTMDTLNYLKNVLNIHMNSSDDNPAIILEKNKTFVSTNFDVTTLSLGVEMLISSLSHLSKTACYRTIKISDPQFTGLSRFLTPVDVKTIAYGTIQKTFTALDTENRMLANPSSMDFYSLAGTIEDHATNLTLICDKALKLLDNIRYIIGIEMMHAVQAIDLRKNTQPDLTLGKSTKRAYEIIRNQIPYYDKDRNISIDIKKAYEIIINKELNHLF